MAKKCRGEGPAYAASKRARWPWVIAVYRQLQGWQYSFIGLFVGLGAGIGPLIGAYFGNKKAAKVGAYREEWLGKRKAQGQNDSTGDPD